MLARMTKLIGMIVVAVLAISHSGPQDCRFLSISAAIAKEKSTGAVLKAGEKYWIGDEYYFVYHFDKKPQMGTIILKVQVFTKNGKQDSSLEITGDASMPSMKGAHNLGNQPFKLNKKGDYLLPVNVVMPGDWEVVLNFVKDNQVIYTGSVRFNV